jgi:autotransporter-associated beta strand protein
METHFKFALRNLAAACATIILAVVPAKAATMSASSTAPSINDVDIANYGDVTGTDKWFVSSGTDGGARGQSITTGGAAVRLKAITYQVSEGNGAEPTKTYALRVGKVAGNTFTQVHSETATQNFSWTSGQYMTWTFDTPVLLEPYTTYGIDVGMTGSTSNWQSGIPYMNVTGDEYAGGTSYASGTSGIGTSSLSAAISSDRTFHLDIERPLSPVFSLVAPSPADNASDVFASREIVMTFSQTVTPGTGNLTICNLTNGTDTPLAANDSRLTYDQNVVRINPAGLITWSKNYAIRIDAGMFLGDGGAPIAAITDDTTWNFTTLSGDPLLVAIAALKAHINGTTLLTGAQISAHKTTLDNQRQRFVESTEIINAVFDLITTYDTRKGPLFVTGSAVTGFSRNNTTPTSATSVSSENYHWVVYTVMQYAMDLIYTAENLAKYEATLTNYKFGSHTSFPGPCLPPANPLDARTVAINGSFPQTFGRNTQSWTTAARKPTGTYLAPGTVATVTVPPTLVNAGYKVRVGAHSWDLSGRPPVNRLERATRLFALNATTIKVASPYGGGIYIEVPYLANAGVVNVTVTGAVRSPYFSAKSFHQTTPAEWLVERAYPAPWADFQSDKFMTQVPRKWIYNHPDPAASMAAWDGGMDAINDLMGFPRIRGKETMYCQTDVILRSAVHAPGYPAVNVTSNVNSEVSPVGYAGNYLVRGPGASLTASNIEFHEQGHAYGFPKFGGESESNVNLLQGAMLNRALGKTFDEAQNGSFGGGNPFITIDNTAVAWMCVFNFSPREVPMADGEKAYQHKGHAKFMDVARLFGWEKLDTYWRSFMEDDANNISYTEGTDDLLLRLSKSVGADVRPLFHFWGIHPQNPTTLAAAITAANLPSSNAIRTQLLHYKTLVPANNAAFRTFATAWRGRQPTINGAWEEREHARQWDTAALYGPGDQQRGEATNPGEIYNENSANDITNRVQELVDLYFPGAITPNPMSFATAPTVVDATTIGMTATTATAGTGPVQYLFEETSGNPGGTNSNWQTNPSYQDTGLTAGLTYTYKVTARDGPLNPTDPSAALSATPTVSGDITPPSPSPMTFATPPNTVDTKTITMTASTATDINGVVYDFENTTNSTNSGWQDSPVYTQTNLQLATSYTYRVRARDKSANFNATAFSAPASTNTGNLPDVVPPQTVSFSPADASSVSNLATNLVVTFDEPVAPGSGSVTLKNLTDVTEVVFSISDSAVTVAGSTLTLNPPTDLLYEKIYAVQISSGAVADVSNNPFIGINDDNTWSFATVLATPIPNTGGPYIVPVGGSLALIGSASIPSTGATISPSGYSWDLSRDNVFGDVTGATPASISDTVLMGTYGMVIGQNTLKLKITDSLGNTATATTIVKIGVNLNWDSNGTSANQTDGTALWLDTNKWRDGSVNSSWISGSTANFGVSGTGGTVTLGSPTTAGALVFNSFAGTYSLSGGGTLTLNNGVTKSSGSGAVSLISSIILSGPQTWANNSTTTTLTSSGGVNNGGNLLTIDGTGNTIIKAGIISGSGGLTKNGTGFLEIGGQSSNVAHSFTGTVTLNGGIMRISNNLSSGNLTLNGGVLEHYWGETFSRTLGADVGQVQILGGASGFSQNGNGTTVTLNGNANTPVVQWGSTYFNPSVLVLQAATSQAGGGLTFTNKLDLNGATRTVQVAKTTSTTVGATISGVISNSTGTAGLTKTGPGLLVLNATNTYNGGTTIEAGVLQLSNASGLGSTSGPLTINSGLLNLNNQTVSIGNLTGTGGTIANNGNAARTLTIGIGNGTGGVYQGVIADSANAGIGSVALTKTGTGTITLAGLNTYTGATLINGGGTLVLTGATQATTAITFAANSSLGLVIGSPVTATRAAVNLANGTLSVTGTPSTPSHVLLTALSITGTPVLAAAIPGYQLAVVGNQLQLNQNVTDPYDAWSGGAAFGADSNGDGIDNGMAWLLGATDKDAGALGKFPAASQDSGNLVLNFTCLKVANRGGAVLKVQSCNNLGITDPWNSHEAEVPEVNATVNGVVFVTSANVDPKLVNVQATIPASSGTRLFGRLNAVTTP